MRLKVLKTTVLHGDITTFRTFTTFTPVTIGECGIRTNVTM